MGPFDIKEAYLHEPYRELSPFYIKEQPQFDGTVKHSGQTGILLNNIYGTPPAANKYFKGLLQHLTCNGYKQSHADTCIFTKVSDGQPILIQGSMDDFLPIYPNQTLIDELFTKLRKKYQTQNLDHQTTYLKWHINSGEDGRIHIFQPHGVQALLKSSQAPKLPTADTKHYRAVLGDFRYLIDSTRPDILFAVNKLSEKMHQPTRSHQPLLKWLL